MGKYISGLVSVVIPTYKRSDKLNRAIDSVLKQTYKKIELLLVNDNEPGDEFTVDVLRRTENYKIDERFHFVTQEQHLNGAVARNVGIRQAKGEYIAFLDDDDWWNLEKIEKQVAVLSSLSSEWGGVSCQIENYNNDKLIAKSKAYKDGYACKNILLLLTNISTSTLLLRHAVLDETGYFDEALQRHQDLQLLTYFTYKYKLKLIKEYLNYKDISDTHNRPGPEELIEIKERFFESVAPIMSAMTVRERKYIYAMHNHEVAYIMFKYGRKMEAFKLALKLLVVPKALYYATKKTILKIIYKTY